MEIIFQNYKITDSEFWKVRNLYSIKIYKIYVKLIRFLIAIALILAGSVYMNTIVIFYVFLIFVILYFVFIISRIYIIPFKRFKKAMKPMPKQNIIVFSEGIKFIIEGINMERKGMKTTTNMQEWILSWNKLKAVFEDDKFYILLYKTKLLFTIPKRLFNNSDDKDLFEEILIMNSGIEIVRI